MSSLWCPSCNTSWPDNQSFEICPRDRMETRELDSGPDLSLKQAKMVLQAHLDFDKFLAERERKAA